MGPNHSPRSSGSRNTFDVRHRGFRDHRNEPSGRLQSPAEIHIFGKHKVPLVKSTDRLKGRSSRDEECSTDPVNLPVPAR
jgi:hypothetical protein